MSDSLAVSRPGVLVSVAPAAPPTLIGHNGGPVLAADDGWPGDLGELLARLVRWFEAAEMDSAEARDLSERDRDYYDGYQWTDAELEALRKRNQPALVINYVRRKVDLMRGLERRARSDPKALPRTPQEDMRADIATQALRYVADSCDFHTVRSDAYDNMLIEGFGAGEVTVKPGAGMDVEVLVEHVPWDRVFYDPHSRRADFEDARYKGVVIWQDRDEALDENPGAETVLENTFRAGVGTGSYDDRPATAWSDNRRTRVRVVQMDWKANGVWWRAKFTRGGFFSVPARSPFKDRLGQSCSPLILQSAYVDRKNRRYGTVRDMIGLQDEINKRRSKALHLLSVNRVIYEDGAVDDIDEARRELARPDGAVKVNGAQMRFEVAGSGDMAQGQWRMLEHATGEMQAQGANASLAGKDGRDLSGRAILAQQAGGQAEIEPLADGLRNWTRRIHEAVWQRVRQFWTAERWIRVTDNEGAIRFQGLNERVPLAEALMRQLPEKRAAIIRSMQLVPDDPRLAQTVILNSVSDLDVDITIDAGPDVPTMEAETFTQLVQLVQAGVQFPPSILIAAAPGLRGKTDILEQIKAMQAAPPPPEQAAMARAKVRETEARAAANEASAADRNASAVERVARVERASLEHPMVPVGSAQVGGYPPPLA